MSEKIKAMPGKSSKTALVLSETDPAFRKQVEAIEGADRLSACFQCGTCTADCPVSRQTEEFHPRIIARMAKLGAKNELFGGDTLWLCANCYTCYEKCPEDVKLTEIIVALRNLAVREGHVHPAFKAQMELIANKGAVYEVTEIENELRETLGLPLIPAANAKDVRTIMKKTGFDKLTGIDLESE